jgi:hypothetical protein
MAGLDPAISGDHYGIDFASAKLARDGRVRPDHDEHPK